MRVRTIYLRDVLEKPIESDGLALDAHVDAQIRQYGTTEYEIDYFDVRDVYIHAPMGLLKLDQSHFKHEHKTTYDRFVNACELEALKKAALAAPEKWTILEDEVSA